MTFSSVVDAAWTWIDEVKFQGTGVTGRMEWDRPRCI